MLFVGLGFKESLPLPSSEMKVDIDIREHELFVGYAAFDDYPELEVITGIRYIDQDISVKITTPGPTQKLNIGDDWVDPFVGLRYMEPINNKWGWYLRGDIGGFNVGSDFAWRVDVGTTYRIDNALGSRFFLQGA